MRTILNILGPLTNPAGAPNQVMGVFHQDLVGIQARVLKMLGSKHVMTVHGARRPRRDHAHRAHVRRRAQARLHHRVLDRAASSSASTSRRIEAIQVEGRGRIARAPRGGARERSRARRATSWC